MTLQELYQAVKKKMPASVPFSLNVEVWDHRRPDQQVDIEWSIYHAGLHKHCTGPTPEAALRAFAALMSQDSASSEIPPIKTDDIPF